MNQPNNLLLTASRVEISATGKTPTVNILAYSGGLMHVPGWGHLVIDLAGLDLSLSQIGILSDHDATLKGIVGHGQAEVRNGKLLVAGTIAEATDAARQIISLAKSGFQFQASVGVSPTKTERVESHRKVEVNGRQIKSDDNGFLLVRSGLLREVSIVAIGADPGMGSESLAEQALGEHVAQRARDIRCTSLVDLCKAALLSEAKDVPRGREAMIRAALSTYALPFALGNAANKVLFEAYNETPATWRSIAATKSCNDFKEHTGVRPSQTGDLEEIPPTGEFKHGSITEALYKYAVDTFGKSLSIDRRDIVNDDLSLFDDTAQSMGRMAMRSLSDFVYKVLLANANAFFSAGNGNYDEGAGTALDSVSLGTGLARMMAQRDEEKRDLDIRARTLLVPPELQQTAKELLQSDFIQRANNDLPTGNALKNSVSLEVEPRLSNADRFSGTSTKAWYLFGSPSDAALIVAFLQGKQSPTVEFFGLDADPNKLAATWRVYFDYGAALGDFRAAYRAKGEA